MIASKSAISAPVMETPMFITRLNISYTTSSLATWLVNVSRMLWMSSLTVASSVFLLLGHGLQAIIERRFDLRGRVLQRLDCPRLVLIVWLHRFPRNTMLAENCC
jgi:hypothetical protein